MVKTTQTHSIADEMACKAGPGQIFSTIYVTAVAICTNVDILPNRLGGNFLTLVNAITATIVNGAHRCNIAIPAAGENTTSNGRVGDSGSSVPNRACVPTPLRIISNHSLVARNPSTHAFPVDRTAGRDKSDTAFLTHPYIPLLSTSWPEISLLR